jgi:hypothetical protein
MTKKRAYDACVSGFVIRISFGFRHSDFVIPTRAAFIATG